MSAPYAVRKEQAYGENKIRRNRFYEQFGIQFNYSDESQSSGLSRPMLTDELVISLTWKQNITPSLLDKHIEKLQTMIDQQKFDLTVCRQQLLETTEISASLINFLRSWVSRHWSCIFR